MRLTPHLLRGKTQWFVGREAAYKNRRVEWSNQMLASAFDGVSRVKDGVLALNKPAGISSAQAIRNVQEHFKPSKLFASWFEREKSRQEGEFAKGKKGRRSWKSRQPLQVKMGHGGTLDPMATGVLILGIGEGTKKLPTFLECTKTYETVVLFGAATDTYDSVGKVLARKPYQQVTRAKVTQALDQFRGKVMQRPPIFSALRMDGKRLYEYAREGKELPREIVERPVEVPELELVEWLDGGTHEWQWPEQEADNANKLVADKVMGIGIDAKGTNDSEPTAQVEGNPASCVKRHLEDETIGGSVISLDQPSPKRSRHADEPLASGALQEDPHKSLQTAPSSTGKDDLQEAKSSKDAESAPEPQAKKPACPAPACRLRMTVTSGFYVRSLCHDLGMAVDSLGLMADLTRTRQAEFELGKNVLEYSDLEKGEEVWGPKVEQIMSDWAKQNLKTQSS